MDILTLLKANIRHRKGSFTSIIILMIIIAMSLTAVLSVKDNCKNSIENALEQVNAANLTVFISDEKLTDELLSSVKNDSMVDSVADYTSICTKKAETAENTETNSWFLLKLRDEFKLFNSDLTAYEDETPELKDGEIYITQGIMTNMKCNVGDKIKIYTIGGETEFTIKGIVAEPVNGCAMMGWKQVFISDGDFERLRLLGIADETEEISGIYHVLKIYKTPECTLTDNQFRRQLNLDTGITDNSVGSMSKEMSLYYTNLYSDIILSVLTVFIVFLIVIVLIVMAHSISTGIEMDYVNLGVLKSLGFTKDKIKAVFILQYLLAQFIGAAIGVILAVPLINALGNVFQPITAILAENNISIIKCLSIILSVLLISGLFILLITKKVGKISPVKAISGGRSEIYFDSRIKAPICKKGLSSTLALRQFTSSKRRYAGTITIVTILVFFMMTMSILGNVIDSKSAIESMAGMYTECDVRFKEDVSDKTLKEIENTIEEYTNIEKKYYLYTHYLSINGEELHCTIYKNPEAITNLTKGRAPLYSNEIVITDILADELNLNMGDKVAVSYRDKKSEFIISGFYQSINDTGRCFAMPLTGAKKLDIDTITYGGYSLSDTSKCKEIEERLNNDFGDILEANAAADGGEIDETFSIAINAMQGVIYSFSVIFALVVIIMVCAKTFMQERTDIGIYKSLGFTSRKLRLQFAIRFLIISLIGSAIGSLLSVLLSGRVLNSILRIIGITNFAVDFTAATFIIPILLICICFFLFSYFVSRKIKRVEIRELVTE